MLKRLSTAQIIASDLNPESKVAALMDRLRETADEMFTAGEQFHAARRIKMIANAISQEKK